MQALQVLPGEYQVKRIIDFTKGRWLLLMNIIAVPAFLLFGAFFLFLATYMRRESLDQLLLAGENLALCLPTLFLSAFSVILHESIHGLGFWWFTRAIPRFGCNFWGAYAAAPDWYVPRDQYLAIGLAPSGAIISIGIILLFLVPASLVLVVVWLLTLNAASAVGDMLICLLAVSEPRSALIQDAGMKITVFCKRVLTPHEPDRA